MEALPHRYRVRAHTRDEAATATLGGPDLPELASCPPREFGGSGGHWSPETLLVAAVVDCFTLGFHIIAEASRYPWRELDCEGEGVVDRADGGLRFTALRLRARLRIPPDGNAERGERLLRKAEEICLVSRSLKVPVALEASVDAD